jgi:hypothetical protein
LGVPPRHRPKFKNDRRPLTQRLRSNNKIIEAAKSVASNKQINASNKKNRAAQADLIFRSLRNLIKSTSRN